MHGKATLGNDVAVTSGSILLPWVFFIPEIVLPFLIIDSFFTSLLRFVYIPTNCLPGLRGIPNISFPLKGLTFTVSLWFVTLCCY